MAFRSSVGIVDVASSSTSTSLGRPGLVLSTTPGALALVDVVSRLMVALSSLKEKVSETSVYNVVPSGTSGVRPYDVMPLNLYAPGLFPDCIEKLKPASASSKGCSNTTV